MIPTSAHNEALTGDTLYSAFLNREWREIVLPFIIAGMDKIANSIDDETERQDFEVLYGAMIDDFYNEEVPVAEAIGSIKLWASETIPASWLWCNGQSLAESAYPDLFALIGNTFGSAGAGFFNLPQTGFRFILGIDDFAELGDFGGAAMHTLTIAEMPSHSHATGMSTGTGAGGAAARGTNTVVANANTNLIGGGGAHNNMPPYRRLAYIIKALP